MHVRETIHEATRDDTYCEHLMRLIGTGKITLGAINFAAKANGRTVDVISSASDPRSR